MGVSESPVMREIFRFGSGFVIFVLEFQQGERARTVSVNKNRSVIIGWIISAAGTVLWLYGYYATGNPSFIDWQSYTPWWIASFLPNIESEAGMALLCVGTISMYCPHRT